MYTRKQACEILKISMPTLQRKMEQGLIHYYKNGESKTCKVLFTGKDLREYLEKYGSYAQILKKIYK